MNFSKFQNAMTQLWRDPEAGTRFTADLSFSLTLGTLATVVATSTVQSIVIFQQHEAFCKEMVIPCVMVVCSAILANIILGTLATITDSCIGDSGRSVITA